MSGQTEGQGTFLEALRGALRDAMTDDGDVLLAFEAAVAVVANAIAKTVTGRVALGKDEFLLPAELFIFRAPRSYTRQEVVEFHTAGAPAVLAMVMDHASTLGARRPIRSRSNTFGEARGRLS